MTEENLSVKEAYFKKYGRDSFEMTLGQIVEVDSPATKWRYRMMMESFNASIEETYFWILNYLTYEMGFAQIDKITDLIAASEHSAFFGVSQQRVGLQQDKVSQFLATIGKMTKELFQLVREIRVLDERLGYYDASFSEHRHIAEPGEVTLKGLYIDMAEGGSKSPASVYGMARELQFTILPDLFFSTTVKEESEINKAVEDLDFNKSVKHVLKRKLFSFYRWKKETYKELKSRRIFTVKYLKQHFEIIRMYMVWVKPYLRNLERMRMDHSKTETPDLISAFEGSMIEIELLARFWPEGNSIYQACVLVHLEYRTMPSMNYQQEGYQRGPIHVGEVKVTYRSYAWTEEQIKEFKDMRDAEDFDLLATIDGSVRAAMEALGDDLMQYLAEAGEEEYKPKDGKKKDAKPPGIIDGFRILFSGPKKDRPKGPKMNSHQMKLEEAEAASSARGKMWLTYKNYKKAHKMLTW